MRTDFYYATDSLTHWEPIPNTPESLESISSGVYDSEGNRFWMVDSSGKIWEYSLSDATWRARSLVPTRMKNYSEERGLAFVHLSARLSVYSAAPANFALCRGAAQNHVVVAEGDFSRFLRDGRGGTERFDGLLHRRLSGADL